MSNDTINYTHTQLAFKGKEVYTYLGGRSKQRSKPISLPFFFLMSNINSARL